MSDQKRIIYGQEFCYHDAEHYYTWGGQPVPGVTTALRVLDKPALIPWASKLVAEYFLDAVSSGRTDYDKIFLEAKGAPNKRKEDAGGFGTNVHKYAEAVLKKLPLPELVSDQAKKGAEAFHKWFDSHKIEVLASERICFSQEFYYGGTCDLVANIDGEQVVGDFKTSSGIYNEARFQTAAYQQALEEETGAKFAARIVIRFDKKTGKFETKTFRNFDLDFAGFKHALEIHRTLQAIKQEKTA
jgi:hypothetical protein